MVVAVVVGVVVVVVVVAVVSNTRACFSTKCIQASMARSRPGVGIGGKISQDMLAWSDLQSLWQIKNLLFDWCLNH